MLAPKQKIQFYQGRPGRLSGYVREVMIARGWLKKAGEGEPLYTITKRGLRFLKNLI